MSVIKDDVYEEEVSTSIAVRQKLKISFLELEKEERQQYVADLEATIVINKQIIQELCTSSTDVNAKTKAVFDKLNRENVELISRVKNLVKQRSELEGKVLIHAQIIEENRRREAEHLQEYKETALELKEQLNKKEYILQHLEKRCSDAEQMIMKYLKNSPEARSILAQMQITINQNTGISNVVEQNKLLKAKVIRLTGELSKAKDIFPGIKLPDKVQTEIKRIKSENEALKSQLADIEKENRELRGENAKLRVDLDALKQERGEIGKHTDEGEIKPTLSEFSSIVGEDGPDLNGSQDMHIVLELNTKDIR